MSGATASAFEVWPAPTGLTCLPLTYASATICCTSTGVLGATTLEGVARAVRGQFAQSSPGAFVTESASSSSARSAPSQCMPILPAPRLRERQIRVR
ncbi:hypothetical protein ACFPRL_10895 [Pseudoclavibacter helvolus]